MRLITITSALLLSVSSLIAQTQKINVAIVGSKISDFTLQTYQGDTFSTNDLRGKNILLIASRGKYKDNAWCSICHYQYAQFNNLEITQKIRDKYNLEIAFLFPFIPDTFKSWEKAFPKEMQKIENWKYPINPDSLNEGQKSFMELARKIFPNKFDFATNPIELNIPLLIDKNFEVSKGLDLYRTEWGGTKTIQNIPAVILIDKEGIVRFKYISQNTIDRPSPEYILKMLDNMVKGNLD